MADSLPLSSDDADQVRASQSDFADLWARARRAQTILSWILFLAASINGSGAVAAAVKHDWFVFGLAMFWFALSIIGWAVVHWTVVAWHNAAIARVQAARAGSLVDQWREAYLKLKRESAPSQ
jgi:hypothetical protein